MLNDVGKNHKCKNENKDMKTMKLIIETNNHSCSIWDVILESLSFKFW